MKIFLSFILFTTAAFSAEGVFGFLREDEEGKKKALVISFRSYGTIGHLVYFNHDHYYGDYRMKFEPEYGYDPFVAVDPFASEKRERDFKISPNELYKNRFKGDYFLTPDYYDMFALEGVIASLRKKDHCYLKASSDVNLTWMSEGKIVKTESYENTCFLLVWQHIREQIEKGQNQSH